MVNYSRKAVLVGISFSFICLLLLESPSNWNKRKTNNSNAPTISLDFLKLVENGRRVLHQKFNLSFVSKRRVPNGPDPIHNRRAGNNKLPPVQGMFKQRRKEIDALGMKLR